MNMRGLRFEEDRRPLVVGCTCYTCTRHTRAYVRHLLNTHEMTGDILLMMSVRPLPPAGRASCKSPCRCAYSHNVHHYMSMFASIRRAIDASARETFDTAAGAPLHQLLRAIISSQAQPP